MSTAKQELRDAIRIKLRTMPEHILSEKSQKIARNLHDLLSSSIWAKHKFVLGGYASMSDEPSWYGQWADMLQAELAFPGVDEHGDMAFYLSRYEDLIVRQDFGPKILTPKEGSSFTLPEVLLIPGRAFTLQGDRLGRGKGCYDRYLKDFKGVKIGICFLEQVLEHIPVTEHDRPVDYIITDCWARQATGKE